MCEKEGLSTDLQIICSYFYSLMKAKNISKFVFNFRL